MTMIEVVILLVLLDTILGTMVAMKHHNLKSAVGRQDLTKKVAEVCVISIMYLVSILDSEHFPPDLVSTLYWAFAFFEFTSIAENLNLLGLISDELLHTLRIDNEEKKQKNKKIDSDHNDRDTNKK